MPISLSVNNYIYYNCIYLFVLQTLELFLLLILFIIYYFFISKIYFNTFCLDLLEAAENGSTGHVMKLLDAGVNIEHKNYYGEKGCQSFYFFFVFFLGGG